MKRPVQELIREKREWHTPHDPEAAKLGFKGWNSCGYLPHFDMPGVWQMINYRLADAMPAERRHEWESMLSIDNDLQRQGASGTRAARCWSLAQAEELD
jgi:hypothetical protein